MFLASTLFSWNDLHPILVNFTAALIPASVGSDLLGKVFRRDSLNHAAWWMLLYAALITPFTVLAGWFWKNSLEPATLPADVIFIHQWLGTFLSVGFLVLAVWRGRLFMADEKPNIIYFVVAALVVAALMYQGSLGGKMAFG